MQEVELDGAPETLERLVRRVRQSRDRVVLTRRGKRLVAVVPIEDVEWLEEIEDQIDREEARKALEESEREGTIPWEQVKAELGL